MLSHSTYAGLIMLLFFMVYRNFYSAQSELGRIDHLYRSK